jgi:hypothetical protein
MKDWMRGFIVGWFSFLAGFLLAAVLFGLTGFHLHGSP